MEEDTIRATLAKIQGMILPNMDALQKNIEHVKTLIHDNNFSIANHVMKLSTKVQIALHESKLLQENWDNTVVLILKVHSNFLSHFVINLYILYTFGIYVENGEKYICLLII